jgi:DNA mismatch repair protein MutS
MTDPRIQLSGGLYFSLEDVRFVSASTSTDEIDIPCLKNICKSILVCGDQMNQEIAAAYQRFLTDFENTHLENLEHCADFVAKMDVLHCKAYIANSYNYCKPTITESPQSFVDARDLRHVLIEHLQTNEIYVANDVSLQRSGILLYGTNAVGKTSFIRALGISIIMAQSGLYVPCSQFSYCPYRSIFSRILGNDNLFKGLSTFAVEMSELRMILRSADDCSLILGDELCSGTETESALSIFMAGLLDLHEKGASFIFATHFHEIMNYDEMEQLDRVAIKHMAVRYDREMDCLIYDRKLQDGPGNRMYGLEVCKSLYLPEDFLRRAMAIRDKYHPTSRGELAHTTSTYNAQKIRGICEMCNTHIGEEIHHLQPQKKANDKGFIGSIHMNHPANLMTLCETCHTKTHQANVSMKRTKTTKGYVHLAAAVGTVGNGELGQLP